MQAVRLEQGACRVIAAPDPERQAGEALIRTRLVGVCDTDLQLLRGYAIFSGTPGHEFVGDVVEADDASLVGARVVGDINAGCGTCEDCLKRGGHHCERRTVLGIAQRAGAMAEYFTLPERCLVSAPATLSDEQLVFAEPLAAALHVLDDLPDTESADDPVMVLGDGKLGLLIAWALVSAGRRVLVVGHHDDKLRLARSFGAQVCFEHELDGDPQHTSSIVEATGSSSGLGRALACARPRATVILKTTVAEPIAVDLAPVVVNELRLLGSRCGDMSRAVSLLAGEAASSLAPLIAARYPLSRAADAFAHAARPGTLKVLLEPGATDV